MGQNRVSAPTNTAPTLFKLAYSSSRKPTIIVPFLLCHYFNCDIGQYQVVEILGIPGSVQPHFAYVLIDGATADD